MGLHRLRVIAVSALPVAWVLSSLPGTAAAATAPLSVSHSSPVATGRGATALIPRLNSTSPNAHLPAGLAAALHSSEATPLSHAAIARVAGNLVTAAGGLHARFQRDGVALAGSTTLSLRATSVGRGAMQAVAPVTPTIAGGRAVYRHATGITEWYRTTARGLEEGVTLAHRPAGTEATVTVNLSVHGAVDTVPASHASTVQLHDRTGARLRVSGLRAVDATGRSFPAWMDAAGSTIHIRVRDAGARYPLTIDPYVQQWTFDPSDGGPWVTDSIAFSGDGTLALIGEPAANRGAGQVQLATDSGGSWSVVTTLTPTSPQLYEGFGATVSLSDDGTTAFISAPFYETTTCSDCGGVFVFSNNGGTWTQAQILTGDPGSGFAAPAQSVAISGDGSTAIVGEPGYSTIDGAVLLYAYNSGTSLWELNTTLHPSDPGGGFGYAVGLSHDGSTALVTAPYLNDTGSGFLYTRDSVTGWATTPTQTFTGSDSTSKGSLFGTEGAISPDGATIVVGSDSTAEAYVFHYDGVDPPTQIGDPLVSWSQNVSVNDSVVLLGNDIDTSDTGSAAVYTCDSTANTCTQEATLTASDGQQDDDFGRYLGLAAHADVAGVIAVYADGDNGATYIFSGGASWSQAAEFANPNPYGAAQTGTAVALSADGSVALIGMPDAIVSGGGYAGVAVVYIRSGGTWTQSATLQEPTPSDADGFGAAVALSPDGRHALIGAPGAGSGTGAAYIFDYDTGSSTWNSAPSNTFTDTVDVDGGSGFGWAVALSGDATVPDGLHALIGEPFESPEGVAFAYTFDGATWSSDDAIVPSNTPYSDTSFGWAVALNADGTTALIGDPGAGLGAGMAFIDTRTGSTWSQAPDPLTPSVSFVDAFGYSVALSADGSHALVGSPAFDFGGQGGSAHLYQPANDGSGDWPLTQTFADTDESDSDYFGIAVALNGDGSVGAIGASGAYPSNDPTNYDGATFVERHTPFGWTQSEVDGDVNDDPLDVGQAVSLSSDGIWALVGGPQSLSGAGVAYADLVSPAPPASVTAVPGNNSISVSWDPPPAIPDAPPVSGYDVAISCTANCVPGGIGTSAGATTTTTAGSQTITGLNNGSTYVVSVYSTSSLGISEPTASDPVVPGSTAPGKVQNLAITPTKPGITVTWDAPADDGGSPITEYDVVLTGSDTSSVTNFVYCPSPCSPADLTTDFNSLAASTSYTVTVTAVNTTGSGPGTQTAYRTGSPTAALLASLAVSRVHGVLTVRWTAAETSGLVGFAVYAGTHRLNRAIIAVHASPHYAYSTHTLPRGPIAVRALLSSGGSVTVSAG